MIKSIKKLDRKSLIYTGILIAVLILGGLGFYLFSRAMADNAANQDVCSGLSNSAWRNCTQNLNSWRKFLGNYSNKHFAKTIEAWDDNARTGQHPQDIADETTPTPTPTETSPTPTPTVTEASMQLSPASGSHSVGQIFEVTIKLDTFGQEASGAQIELVYDPAKLEVQDDDNATAGTQVALGSLFSTKIQDAVSGGKILVAAGSIPPASNFTGNGTFATVRFKALATGTTEVNFNTSTTKAAKAGTGENILTGLTGGSYTITQ